MIIQLIIRMLKKNFYRLRSSFSGFRCSTDWRLCCWTGTCLYSTIVDLLLYSVNDVVLMFAYCWRYLSMLWIVGNQQADAGEALGRGSLGSAQAGNNNLEWQQERKKVECLAGWLHSDNNSRGRIEVKMPDLEQDLQQWQQVEEGCRLKSTLQRQPDEEGGRWLMGGCWGRTTQRRAVAMLTETAAGFWSVPDDKDVDLLPVSNTAAATRDVGATVIMLKVHLEEGWIGVWLI